MTPLTDKQLEAAAREYCRLMNLDPDGEHEWMPGFTHLQSAISELSYQDTITIALSVGRGTPE